MKNIYETLILIQQICKNGLLHTKSAHDQKNYEEISKLSLYLLENVTNIKYDRDNIFVNESHVTPSISVRTLILKDNKILMVKEKDYYSLPGGWCDLYESIKEAAIREVKEEAGLIIDITNLIGILNLTFNGINEYAVFFKGEILNDLHIHDFETSGYEYFSIDHLPKLSPHFSKENLMKIYNAYKNKKIIIE